MTNAAPEFREELKVREAGKLSRTVRSGGPRTAAGKVLSAKNSLKTGMYSNLPVLPGESQESYLELEGYFIKEYNPQTITDGMLVSDLTKNVWKKLRLERIESNNFTAALIKPISPSEYIEVGFSYPRWVEGYLEEVENVESYDLEESKALFKVALVWVLEHKNEILEANQRVRDERLRRAIQMLGLTRQFDDVNRRIFKLMDELRKVEDRRVALAKPVAKATPRRIGAKQNV